MANQRTSIIDKTTTVAGEQPSRRNNVKITPRVNSVAMRHVSPTVDGRPSVTPQLSQIPRTRADPGDRSPVPLFAGQHALVDLFRRGGLR
jgi:hypothetical protein